MIFNCQISFLYAIFFLGRSIILIESFIPFKIRVDRARSSSAILINAKLPGDGQKSSEETLTLKTGIDAESFLSNIRSYGEARMARRAVGILEKMKAYRVMPNSQHYTAALWACESSNQFEQAVGVFKKMKNEQVPRISDTYAALISCAEKSGYWEEAVEFLKEMRNEGLTPDTQVYNSVMWACDRGGHSELALELLLQMETENVPRDAVTYSAACWAVEKNGVGSVALHVLDLMRAEQIEMNVVTYNAAIWACVKGGMWQEALQVFDELISSGLKGDIDSYNGAIWACEQGVLADKAVELLREIKLKGMKRKTMSFDGALMALEKAGDWEQCLELMKWMTLEKVSKDRTTYGAVLTALDNAGQLELVSQVYTVCVREGHYLQWRPGTRTMDVSRYPPAVAKAAVASVLTSIKSGTLGLFNLNIIIGHSSDAVVEDVPEDNCLLEHDLMSPIACGSGKDDLRTILTNYISSSLLDPNKKLTMDYVEDPESGDIKLVIPRNSLTEWLS